MESSIPRKLVVVAGATGGQGGSVIKRLLPDKTYRLRGITRNSQSKSAQDLAAKGVEMVEADLNDLESVKNAFKDANIIFAVTNFFETFPTSGPEAATQIEYVQGVNMAKAASATTTLEHFIWSTLPDRNATTNGKFKVPHCDSKAQIDIFIKKDKALLAKTTFLLVGLFAATQQYPLFTPLPVPAAGKHVWLMPCHPSTQVSSIGDHTLNVGHFVRAVITQPALTRSGQYVFATSETITMGKWLDTWGEITGNKTQYLQISLEEFDQLWPMWGMEVGSDLKCFEEFGVDSWGGGKWIGKEELGLGPELIGFREALAALVGTPKN